ncbi:MAG: MBL fold metallo-hydrolase, partial [Solirubrobacterales bacterium]|nr:MBL fold metallo-hydrolase [Solirubrobacterales bacterium]
MTLEVHQLTVGMVAENAYLVRLPGSDRAVLFDPGEEPERLLGELDRLGVTLEAILLTHTHFDHVGAVTPVARATGAPVWCPEIEVGV